MPESKLPVEEQFRESLQDVVAIADKLLQHCPATADLVAVAKLALESDSQLKLLISIVSSQGRR